MGTWKEQTYYFEDRVVGWYITKEKDVLYDAVSCPNGKPSQTTFSSEKEARQWIENKFQMENER